MNTGNKPAKPHCTLGALLPETQDTEKLKHDGWHNHRILVVSADDPRIGWIERQVIEQLGDRLYRDRRAARG